MEDEDPSSRSSNDVLSRDVVEASVDIQLQAEDRNMLNYVSKLVGYVIGTNNKFGISTTFEFTYFCKLDENTKLYVSAAFQANTRGPMSTMSALYTFPINTRPSCVRREATRIRSKTCLQ